MKKTRPLLRVSFVLGMAAHLSLTQLAGSQDEQKVAKPLTTQFVKRQPRLTKPLELKKRPRPRRRQIQREMISVKAQAHREEATSVAVASEVIGSLAKPSRPMGRGVVFGSADSGPRALAQAIEGTREPADKIAMSLELLDTDALDTGQYHAMVVQDPGDKRSIKGFCHLAVVFVPRLHGIVVWQDPSRRSWFDDYVVSSVRRLVGAMNRYTQIRTDIAIRLTMDSAELFKTPWVFFSIIFNRYEFSDYETEVMGKYMMSGGFVFADAHPPWGGYADVRCHELNVVASLGTQGVVAVPEVLPNSHPVYHCYFDFDGPPAAADGAMMRELGEGGIVDHLQGAIVDGRLLAIITGKGYYAPWSYWGTQKTREYYQQMDPTQAIRFGVNTIIFALVQEGSITHRVMDVVRH